MLKLEEDRAPVRSWLEQTTMRTVPHCTLQTEWNMVQRKEQEAGRRRQEDKEPSSYETSEPEKYKS